MVIRYDDMKIDKLLIKEYQRQLETDLKRISGLNDIDILLRGFENVFAKYIGTKHAIAVSSGTDALQLSLLSLGVGKGDSVIMPDLTYPAVPLSVIYTGAEPIIIDVKKDDLEINEDLIEKNIKKNTKAIIAVHMFARPCNLDKILEIGRKYNLYVIEDCCQAESSEYKDKKVGSFGDLSCFSFSYYKPLSSCGGGGGMVCFNDEKYKKIADYTKVWKDDEALLEAGKRFTKMYFLDLAAVKVKFRYLKEIIKSRLKTKKIYEETLIKIKQLKIFRDMPETISVPQNFVVYPEEKNKLGKFLKENGVLWMEPYQPLHRIRILSKYSKGNYPVSEEYYNRTIQLPLFSFMNEEYCLHITNAISRFYK